MFACGGLATEVVSQTSKEKLSQCTNGGCEPFALQCKFELEGVPMCLYSRNTQTPTKSQQRRCDWAVQAVDWFCADKFQSRWNKTKCNWAEKLCLKAEDNMLKRCFWVPTTVCLDPQTAVDYFNTKPDVCFGTCSDLEACN
jgi:hypothetical protein